MHEPYFVFPVLEPDFQAPRLEILEVGAGGHLPVSFASRMPYFYIIGFFRCETKVACGKGRIPVMQAEPLWDDASVPEKFFEFVVGSIGMHEFYKLDFVELVHPYYAFHILAVRACFLPETRGISRVIYWQF